MNNLEKISKDFYDCVNIPIRYIDSSFNVKHNIGSYSIDVLSMNWEFTRILIKMKYVQIKF